MTMNATVFEGDALEILRGLPDECVQMCVTSPPYYGLRDYGHTGQIGAEDTPQAYVERIVQVFREVRRVLKKDGTLWLNLGDSYWSNTATQGRNEDKSMGGISLQKAPYKGQRLKSGSKTFSRNSAGVKAKDLLGIPWMVAFALRADGWFLRQDIIWHKPNPMPESVRDRCTKAHEYVFMMSKSGRYKFDADAIKEESTNRPSGNKERVDASARTLRPGTVAANVPWKGDTKRNRRSVWHVENEHEYVFLLAKSGKYKYDADAIKEPVSQGTIERAKSPFQVRGDAPKNRDCRQDGNRKPYELGNGMRNRRSVWTITPKPFKGAHFATFSPALVEPCVLAGSSPGDIVLDPFNGAGTTGLVALQHGREYLGIELNADYITLTKERFEKEGYTLA